jgi:hypothetical protein
MDYSEAQAECLRKIYSAILEQPSQLAPDTSQNPPRVAVPKIGSRLDTVHRYARAASGKEQNISVAEGTKRLEELFATLDPDFMQLFAAQDRSDLFVALGTVMSKTEYRVIAPYNKLITGLWY